MRLPAVAETEEQGQTAWAVPGTYFETRLSVLEALTSLLSMSRCCGSNTVRKFSCGEGGDDATASAGPTDKQLHRGFQSCFLSFLFLSFIGSDIFGSEPHSHAQTVPGQNTLSNILKPLFLPEARRCRQARRATYGVGAAGGVRHLPAERAQKLLLRHVL